MSNSKEVINLEEYAKAGKPVPKEQKYKFRVDKNEITVMQEKITGSEILTLAGKTPPQNFILQQKIKGQVVRIGLNDVVDLTVPGVERFMTIPNEVTEGEAPAARRQFDLLAEDVDFLESLGLQWESVSDDNKNCRVLIHGYPLPAGYNVDKVSVFVYLPPNYPDVQIDMAYFLPKLSRKDGKLIGALSDTVVDGQTWQRWSRHRKTSNQWRIGEDNLRTHMALVSSWLEQELAK
ncbi:MAG: multiubiquitin domain-containing protein [Methylophilus sp.]|nr:multiubiquitin domain-containing protein [Methylophilus sp.]